MKMETRVLCRICFEEGHYSLNGYEFNVQGVNISIQTMIKRFSDIEHLSEYAPEMICETCAQDLVQSYLFSEKVKEADTKILSFPQPQSHERPNIYEEEVIFEKDSKEEDECQNVKFEQSIQSDDTIQNEDSALEQTFIEDSSQDCEIIQSDESLADEEIQYDETAENEISESRIIEECYENETDCIVEEVFIDSESPEGLDELLSVKRSTISPQITSTGEFPSLLSSKNILEDLDEPKKKMYKRRSKKNNEVDESGSFVITQFGSSTTAKLDKIQPNLEDTDEIPLSDVRVMQIETVEVKANDMGDVNKNDHAELPVDDSRVYLCQYCPKAFSSSTFLISHVRKSHGCSHCAKVFNRANDLFMHIREEHRSFKCVVCLKDFVNNSNLRNHLKSVHKVKVPANTSLLSYKKNS